MQDRSSLWLALMAVLAAVFVTTGRLETTPPAKSTAGGKGSSDAARIKPGRAEGHIGEPQCDSTPEPLRPLCRAVYEPGEAAEKAADWQRLPWVKRVRGQVRFAIVFVADPDLTGDTLRFDRTIETVQNVAEGLRYSFTGYWIPWLAPEAKTEPAKPAREPSPDPGMLVFRGNGETLVLFLVGESAVSGIQKLQFLNAISYMRVFFPGGVKKVRIAGPNFSGSLAPLKRAILQAREVAGGIDEFRVISPSTTVLKSGADFQNANQPVICFRSAVHNDGYALGRLNGYLQWRWPWRAARRASLRESATTFGKASGGSAGENEVLAIQFPRGIFRLRNASPEASARALFTPESGGLASEDRLTLSLHGPGPGSERVPTFAADQAAVAQEAILLSISQMLHQYDVQLARIVSSDVYDSIFLAGFLRNTCPDVRPYCINADLLTVRAAERLPLEGSLAMTTFPLIPQQQVWETPGKMLQPMSSRFEVGLHRAFQALLQEDLAEHKPPLDLPQELKEPPPPRSPLWLTVVGTNGYWPIAVLDRFGEKPDPLLLGSAEPTIEAHWPTPGEPARAWTAVFTVLLLGAIALGGVVRLAQRDATRHILGLGKRSHKVVSQKQRVRDRVSERLLARWSVRPAEPGAAGRAFFATGACLVASVMLFAMAGPVWMIAAQSQDRRWAVVCAGVSIPAIGLLLAAAYAPWRQMRRAGDKKSTADINARLYCWSSAAGVLGFLCFVVLWSLTMATGGGLAGFFFCYRSLDLLNGVCPTMPFLFLCAGLLVLIALHQRRHALVGELPDSLPKLADEGLAAGLDIALQKAKEPLGHPLVSAQPANILVAAAGIATLCFLPLTERQQSLESMWYDALHWSTLVVFYVLVVLTWARFLVAWMHLKRGLDTLAALPLSGTFATLPAGHGLCTILRGRARYGAAGLLAASLRTLRALVPAARNPKVQVPLANALTTAEREIGEYLRLDEAPEGAPAGELAAIQPLLAETGTLIAGALKQGQSGDDFERLGTQFIALQYAAFAGNVMVQLRNLLLFVTSGFFLGIVSTLVYPFRSQHAMAWAATLNFIVLGLPVLRAIVQMETHPLLSAAARDEHSQFSGTAVRVGLYLALPLVGLIGSHFPALGRFLVMLLQPAMHAAR